MEMLNVKVLPKKAKLSMSTQQRHKNCPCPHNKGTQGVRGTTPHTLNLLAPELFFLILAHPVYKM